MATISPVYLSGFDRAPATHTQSSVNASVGSNNTHQGKPATIEQESTARAAKLSNIRQTVARQAAPTTSYNAQGQVQSLTKAETGRRFHAEA